MTQKPSDKKSGTNKGSSRERKERVLHTRIPTVLEDELKQLAENLRVPVSNLVRTILQDALGAVEVVGRAAEEEIRDAADRLARQREHLEDMAASTSENLRDRVAQTVPDFERVERPAPKADPDPAPKADPAPLEGVIGFQELVLAIESRCALCDRALTAGEPAYLGVRDVPGPRVIIGPECLPGNKEND